MDTPGVTAAHGDGAEVLRPGTKVGRWIVGEPIGRGASATVYAARHADLGRDAALKVLHEGARFWAEARARFLREGRAAAALTHPNAVAVLAVAVHDGMPCLVMEYIAGETLAALLAREGVLPVGRALGLLLPLCAAVSSVHRAGVVHRDIKPSNVSVVRDATGRTERPVLLDFGAARLLVEGDDDLTRSRALLGTPAYMAPEQARAARAATPACDQFALAAVLLQMVSGVLPYRGERWTECFAAAVRGEVVDVAVVAPSLPRPFASVLRRALSADPARRFGSVDEFARALAPFAGAAAGVGKRARPGRLLALVCFAGLLVAVTAVVRWRGSATGPGPLAVSSRVVVAPIEARPSPVAATAEVAASHDAGIDDVVPLVPRAGRRSRTFRRVTRRVAPSLGSNEAPILGH